MNETPLSIALHPSAWPQAQRAAVPAALRAGRLPPALLYQSPAQAQRWLDYHAAWSPSRTDTALRALYGEAFAAAAAALAAQAPAVLLLGVGSGGGHKDAELLQALAHTAPGRALHYVPLDASAALAADAALHVREAVPGAHLHPLAADVGAEPALEDWLAACAPGAPRVVSCLGLLPNQDARVLPAWLARTLRAQDVLLLSTNLAPGGFTADAARILLQYDNPPARAWYRGALAELGLAAQAYALEVLAQPLPGAAALGLESEAAWEVLARATLRETTELGVSGEALRWPAGARLEAFRSQRFTAAAAAHLLAAAGLRVEQRWLGAGDEEGIFLCRRA
jgi:uncharacterized SAM-dependent methyltransferase